MPASVFTFNPFAEGYIAHGKGFTPVKHQAKLADDLANLPQFLCEPKDIVLLAKRPSASFLEYLRQGTFNPPRFVETKNGKINLADPLWQTQLGTLRPWAWGPDSVELLAPLFPRLTGQLRAASDYFNEEIARLYSKAWSADFLRKVLSRFQPQLRRRTHARMPKNCRATSAVKAWCCSEQEVGVVVDTLEGVIEAVAEVRSRGHHRVVVKEAFGLAGHNAIRLWEPEILRTQRQWLAQALEEGSRLVVEPWLEREVDFSAQLEMEPCGLKLCGYTGLINDHRGQFLANWAEADSSHSLPGTITDFFGPRAEMSEQIESIWNHIFSLLEAELQKVGFLGPVSIDAFVYRTTRGEGRLKPVVEINPRYTMGRLTLELMKHACPGSCGLFRAVSLAEAAKEGFSDFPGYARSLTERLPLSLERDSRIRKGAICLNDPETAQAWLATFEVSRTLENLGEARLHTIPRRLPMPRPNTGSR